MSDFEKLFQGTLCRLLLHSPFSFNLLVGMEHVANDSIETMGVRVKSGRISLFYNPNFFVSLEEDERTFVFIHEMMHVLLHHCTHRNSGDPCRAYKENVAMDLAVNSLIKETTGIAYPRFKSSVGTKKTGDIMCLLPSMFHMKDGLSYEQYLDLLDKKYPDRSIKFCIAMDGNDSPQGGKDDSQQGDGKSSEQKLNSSSKGSSDNHVDISEECELGKISKHRIDVKHGDGHDEDAFLDDYIRNAVEQISRNQQWGNLGHEAIEMVKKAQEQPLNWRDILQLKLGPFLSFQKTQSRRRWNKHYGKPFLGSTSRCVEPVAVYADTSGSVRTEDLSRFIVEIERIANYTGVYLWSFDTEVKDPDEFVCFNRCNIESINFNGRGGTCFAPIFEHAKSKEISQVVILTDGFAPAITPQQVEGLEVIWVLVKGGDKKGKPGTVIEMN